MNDNPYIAAYMNNYAMPTRSEATRGFSEASISVLDQLSSLEVQKVDPVDARQFNQTVEKTMAIREQDDIYLKRAPPSTAIPATIKVEKGPTTSLEQIAAKREEEARQLASTASNHGQNLLTTIQIKKQSQDKLEHEMEELIRRRQLDMKNIVYK